MAVDDLVTVSGLPGSPYTRKMLAVLRYRRLRYSSILPAQARERALPDPRVQLFPTVYLPASNGTLEAVTDSTPIIRRLDTEHAERQVIPANAATAFIDMLLEDYGDEWLTKATFHYRWAHNADIERGRRVLPLWFGPHRPDDVIAAEGESFARRQIARLHVVGSNDTTGPLIEASYERLLDLLNAHLRDHAFLLGARPGAGDFAFFGQLTQLAGFDPTPMALAMERAPRVYAWSTFLEDLSGVEPREDDWFDLTSPPATLVDLLGEVGRTYAPVMAANARAVDCGAERVDAEVDGRPWTQKPFAYQAKCVKWLRDAYEALDADDRSKVDMVLAGTGCEILLED